MQRQGWKWPAGERRAENRHLLHSKCGKMSINELWEEREIDL